ncbi:phosphotransferase family protein [Streptomyces cavernae]|uniref:phosphotransferase family protein n=1 Tax=Streptomyces cavernae TaxID=2259034 RepID=UPI000FEBCA72|nr:aminoglycoside phosphotransferase family protein [Streptomyces cavernae]
MLVYETSDETLAVIAGRHGIAAERVRPLPSGVANRVFLLGDNLVLRVPRTQQFLPDLVKEAAVIPVARHAGVSTPEVVAFDGTCSVVDVPYMVLARASGADLERLALSTAEKDRVLHQVGRELAKLHRLSPPTAPDLPAVPVEDGTADPRALISRLVVGGWMDAEAARWLTCWFDRLSARFPANPPMVLVHGDIAPPNLLASPRTAQLTGVVDWGDAQWADPAVDFAKMPLTDIPAMLDGYRQETGEEPSPRAEAWTSTPAWEARVLWFHLSWALGRLADPVPHPGERHWTAPPAGRLLGLLRFFASGPPAPWDELA